MRYLWMLGSCCLLLATTSNSGIGQEIAAEDRVGRVLEAAGGEANLLRRFRIEERLNVSEDPAQAGKPRTSILEPPEGWWIEKKAWERRGEEPAKFLVWAWTLGILVDARSQVSSLPGIEDEGVSLIGLRVTGSVEPPMDLYFRSSDLKLARIDWRRDVHRFSDWRESGGVAYPARCVGYRKASGKPWYVSEITHLERLSELPAELAR